MLSDAHGARLHELGLPAGGTWTLPNFVPAERSPPTRARAGEGEYALVAGRLVAEKGFDTAIAAARAGGGAAGDRRRRARRGAPAGAGGRRRTSGSPAGSTPDALAGVRARARRSCSCPRAGRRPCPYSALDALAAGVPVLASDRGGLPEVVGADGDAAGG